MIEPWVNLKADLARDGCTKRNVIPRILLAPRCLALVLMRCAELHPLVGPVFRRLNYTLNGCDISPKAAIGPGFELPHPVGVVIGPGVAVGANCTIRQHATLGRGGSGDPKIEDGVIIGIGGLVFGGVTVGMGAQVASYAVVNRDVPPGALVVGQPAEVKSIRSVSPAG